MRKNKTLKIILGIVVVALAGYFLYQGYGWKSEPVAYKDLIRIESARQLVF